ncbi:MAG: GxxExxY protein [Planctomycetota bacterium]
MSEPSDRLDRLAHDVIGAAIEVHRVLGAGFLEKVYEEALSIELALRGVRHEKQAHVALSYKGEQVGEARLDLLVDGNLIVELKAVEALHPIHHAQMLNYLKATGFTLGLLINFNVEVLKDGGIKRIVLS